MYNSGQLMSDAIANAISRIDQACKRAGRSPGSVTLIAVTKTRSVEQIRQVSAAGIRDIGESRLQEALAKHGACRAFPEPGSLRWHLVGHLQTNKVKDAVRIFDLIQSVDSLKLASAIDTQASAIGKVQDILVEVKTSGEAAKYGFPPEETTDAVQSISRLPHVRVLGLMTVAPMADAPEKARPYFRRLADLAARINREPPAGRRLSVLSMGMTDDFEIAIEEGATMVRLGRALFGG